MDQSYCLPNNYVYPTQFLTVYRIYLTKEELSFQSFALLKFICIHYTKQTSTQ